MRFPPPALSGAGRLPTYDTTTPLAPAARSRFAGSTLSKPRGLPGGSWHRAAGTGGPRLLQGVPVLLSRSRLRLLRSRDGPVRLGQPDRPARLRSRTGLPQDVLRPDVPYAQ